MNDITEGDFKCIICECKGDNVSFKSQQELQVHTQEHGLWKNRVKPKNVKCDYCPEMFISINNVLKHIDKAHPDKKTGHFCSHCGKYFPLKSSRDLHIKFEHSKSKKDKETFQCQCGVTFYNKKAINYHTKIFHRKLDNILISDIVIMPASNKIQKNNSGEMCSVYYCHLCGAEYVMKSNLRAHVENHHADLKHHSNPQQLIKCTLCSGLFYTKVAYDTHNLLHKPDDQYVNSEQERSRIVHRIDGDFDPSRIPTIWDSLAKHGKRPRVKVIESLVETLDNSATKEREEEENNPVNQSSKSSQNGNNEKKRRNRALVDSDEEIKSDSSDDDEIDIEKLYNAKMENKEIVNKEIDNKGIENEAIETEEIKTAKMENEGIDNNEKETEKIGERERITKKMKKNLVDLDSVKQSSSRNNQNFNVSKRRLVKEEQCIEITPVILEQQKSPKKIKLDNIKECDRSIKLSNINVKAILREENTKDNFTTCDNAKSRKRRMCVGNSQAVDNKSLPKTSKLTLVDKAIPMGESAKPRRSTRKRIN